MKIREPFVLSINNDKVNPLVWFLFVIYIVLTNIVTQLFNMEASRISGIILLAPIFFMIVVFVLCSHGIIRVEFSYFHTYILVFGFFCLASSLWAQSPELAISKGIDIIEIFIIMLIVSICFQQVDSVDSILKAIMWGYYAVILYEIVFYGWDYFVTVMKESTRVTSELLNSNTLGMCAAFAIMINLYLLLSKKISLWTVTLLFFGMVVVIASGSRKALVSLFLGIFFFFLVRSLRKDQQTLPLFRFLIALPVVAFIGYQILRLPIFSGIMKRMEGMFNIVVGGTVEKSAMIRMSLVQLGLELFKQHPLLGVGIDNPRLYTYEVVGETYYLHNNYMEILSSGGIVGFISYYWIYVKLLISYIRRRDFDDLQYCICFVILILLLIMDYGMVSYYSKSTYIFLFLFVEFEKKLRFGRGAGGKR